MLAPTASKPRLVGHQPASNPKRRGRFCKERGLCYTATVIRVDPHSPLPPRATAKPQTASAPKDAFTPSEPPLLLALQPRPAGAPLGILSDVKGATPVEREALQKNLGCIDSALLKRVGDTGLRFQVAHQGDELATSGLLRNQSVELFRTKLPQLKEFGDQLHASLSTTGAAKRNQMAEAVVASDLSLAVFSPRPGRLLAPGHHLDQDPLQTPSMHLMALNHGAKTQEEKDTFYELFKSINGSRVQEAQNETLAGQRIRLSSHPAALERLQKQPGETIPLDVTKHTLLMPDLYFLHGTDGSTVNIDASDLSAVEGWQGDKGHITGVADNENAFNGQYFLLGDINRVLLRAETVGAKTPIHEFGHVVDFLVEKESPEFYAGWKERLNIAFNHARTSGEIVSRYAGANPREYLAEGFAFHHLQPKLLEKKDPALRSLVIELIDRAAGHDPEITRNLNEQFAGLPAQLKGARQFVAANGANAIGELSQVTTQMRKSFEGLAKSGREACIQATSYGLLTGAVEALLLRELGHSPTPTLREDPSQYLPAMASAPVDGTKLVSTVDAGLQRATPRQAFDLAYQAGALGDKLISPEG